MREPEPGRALIRGRGQGRARRRGKVTVTELLEKDKDKLLTELAEAKTAEKAIRVLENETDKLLLRHNENSTSDREREAAAHMMQAVRLALPLIDSAGRTKVWERETKGDRAAGKNKFGLA